MRTHNDNNAETFVFLLLLKIAAVTWKFPVVTRNVLSSRHGRGPKGEGLGILLVGCLLNVPATF